MICNGKIKRIEIELQKDTLEIDADNIISINAFDTEDAFIANSEFDEKNVYDIIIMIKKEADVFLNTENLKGTLFSVLEKNVIYAIKVYTDKEKYRFAVPQELVDVDDCWIASSGQALSEIKGYSDTMNIAQVYGRDDKGNLFISISEENIRRAYEEEDYYE